MTDYPPQLPEPMSNSSPRSLPPASELKLKQFFQLGLQHGCPRDQLLNFVRAGIILQPRQLAASAAARLCDRPDGPILGVGFDVGLISASTSPCQTAKFRFRYLLVPFGTFSYLRGGSERWSSTPFRRLPCGSPGSSVVKNEKSVKFGKVLVKFLALFDHGLPKHRKADRFWTDFVRTFQLD